jgi:hypothetical protein
VDGRTGFGEEFNASALNERRFILSFELLDEIKI